MASERTPLVQSGSTPSDAAVEKPTVYFLDWEGSKSSPHHRRVNSNASQPSLYNPAPGSVQDAEEIETIPEGSVVGDFDPRPVSVAGSGRKDRPAVTGRKRGGWLDFFRNVGKKSSALASGSAGGYQSGSPSVDRTPRAAPVKIDPKVFFANERTFLAWMHVSVILAGASVAIVAFADHETPSLHGNLEDQLYGVVLLPVSIAFILYAMSQYARRASMIRRSSPGPYVDIVGPTVLTVILMLSIVAQFYLKLRTLM